MTPASGAGLPFGARTPFVRLVGARLAVICWLVAGSASGAAADETDGAVRPAPDPLRLLVQADALVASKPAAGSDPQDPPEGATVRLRRVRVGDDVALGAFRLRALFEAAAETSTGSSFTPLAGGRLPFAGPVRATEATFSWVPHRAFRVEVGSLRVPFSLTRQVDEADLRLLERPAFAEALLPDFRAGISFGGDLGELAYRVAVMSADTALDRQLFDRGALVAGRIGAEPLGPVGLAPWRRAETDPWYDWFRFAAGISVLYGTVTGPRTLAVDPDFQAQWRALVVTAEYLFSVRYQDGAEIVPGSTAQGAALEPGVTLLGRRLDLAARSDWERTASANSWGVGAVVTGYGPDPRLRLGAGFERRWGQTTAAGADGGSTWAIVRLTIAMN